MNLLLSPQQLANLKSRETAPVSCEYCSNTFYALVKDIRKAINGSNYIKVKYCSKQCAANARDTRIKTICTFCKSDIIKPKKKITNHNFCSRQCAGKYNNTNKTYGYSRSKLEKWIEQKLKLEYPLLEIQYNNRTTINAELDIYIPGLNLAFELNGIFHYEPIYGEITLLKIQNNDTRKFQACLEHNIELCLIDTSQQKRFTEQSSQKYFEIIRSVITKKQHFV